MVKKEKEMKPWLWNSRENMAAAAWVSERVEKNHENLTAEFRSFPALVRSLLRLTNHDDIKEDNDNDVIEWITQ
jgi:hypothetical protein